MKLRDKPQPWKGTRVKHPKTGVEIIFLGAIWNLQCVEYEYMYPGDDTVFTDVYKNKNAVAELEVIEESK